MPHFPFYTDWDAHLVSEAELAATGIMRLFPNPFDLEDWLDWVRRQLR